MNTRSEADFLRLRIFMSRVLLALNKLKIDTVFADEFKVSHYTQPVQLAEDRKLHGFTSDWVSGILLLYCRCHENWASVFLGPKIKHELVCFLSPLRDLCTKMSSQHKKPNFEWVLFMDGARYHTR